MGYGYTDRYRCRYECMVPLAGRVSAQVYATRFLLFEVNINALLHYLLCMEAEGIPSGVSYVFALCMDQVDRLKQGHVAVGAFGALGSC